MTTVPVTPVLLLPCWALLEPPPSPSCAGTRGHCPSRELQPQDSSSTYEHCAPSLGDLPWQAGQGRRRMGGGDVWKALGAVATRTALTLGSEPSLPGRFWVPGWVSLPGECVVPTPLWAVRPCDSCEGKPSKTGSPWCKTEQLSFAVG